MSELPQGVECKYSYVKVKILSCDKPTYWYADKIGQIVEAQKRSYYRNGKFEGASYWAKAGSPSGKDIGYNGSLGEVEEIATLSHQKEELERGR